MPATATMPSHNKGGAEFSLPPVRTYELPPEGFDPLTASDKDLLHHGFPTRPDAAEQPEFRRLWERFYAQPLIHVTPEFRVHPDKRHGPRLKDGQTEGATSTNWSGVVCFTNPATAPFKWMYGEWTVPEVYAPTAGKTYYSSAWIGIDGDGSPDVFQAGTEQEATMVGGTTSHNTYAWWEWFPNYEVAITTFPVNPGDSIGCLLCVTGTNTGSVYLTNLHTKTHTSFSITAPSGTTLVGNCAEWIVERPGIGGGLSSLAEYGEVYFDNGYAVTVTPTTKVNTTVYPNSGTALTMTNGSSTNLSSPTIETKQLIKLNYLAS